MTPIQFPECNAMFGPPEGMAESQVMTIPAYVTQAIGGSVDGCRVAIVAWQPTEEEREKISTGAPIFISFIGTLPPHFPSVTFKQALNPA